MNLQKDKTRLFFKKSDDREGPVALTTHERFACVWDLTREIFSLSGDFDVESRLQRNVVNITRK
jgi:hypothetical protein